MVIGSGYSAITTISSLLQLKTTAPHTEIIWITRHKENPFSHIANDPLPERKRLTELGNNISSNRGTSPPVIYLGDVTQIEELALQDNNMITVLLTNITGKQHTINNVHHIIANVGYLPDISIYRELHVHLCWASEAPMELAASLLLTGSDDCLSQKNPGPDLLKNPEPNFFILGSKSYGRYSSYLIKVGLEQILQVFPLVAKKT